MAGGARYNNRQKLENRSGQTKVLCWAQRWDTHNGPSHELKNGVGYPVQLGYALFNPGVNPTSFLQASKWQPSTWGGPSD